MCGVCMHMNRAHQYTVCIHGEFWCRPRQLHSCRRVDDVACNHEPPRAVRHDGTPKKSNFLRKLSVHTWSFELPLDLAPTNGASHHVSITTRTQPGLAAPPQTPRQTHLQATTYTVDAVRGQLKAMCA